MFPSSHDRKQKTYPDMKQMPIVLLITLVAIATAHATTKPVRVFILAGQSNMEGHGFVAADPKRNGGKGSGSALTGREGRRGHWFRGRGPGYDADRLSADSTAAHRDAPHGADCRVTIGT